MANQIVFSFMRSPFSFISFIYLIMPTVSQWRKGACWAAETVSDLQSKIRRPKNICTAFIRQQLVIWSIDLCFHVRSDPGNWLLFWVRKFRLMRCRLCFLSARKSWMTWTKEHIFCHCVLHFTIRESFA